MNRSYLAICFLIVVVGVAGGAYFLLKTTPKEPKIEGVGPKPCRFSQRK